MNTLHLGEQQELLTNAYKDFEKNLRTHAFFKLRDRAMSEDLVQETFRKTWGYLLKGGRVELMKAFLYRILNNLIVDEYRKRKHSMTSLDTLVEKGFEPSIDDFEHVLDMIDGKEVIILIKRLPVTYRKVMIMRYVEGLSLKEMADITGQTRNTIAVQTHRGLAQLRKIYERE